MTHLEPEANLRTKRSLAKQIAWMGVLAICVFAGLYAFYASVYSIHHDLAGGALSGSLSVTLGDSFEKYSIYFPPAERLWYTLAAHLSSAMGLRLDLAIVLMTGAAVLFATCLAYRIRQTTVGASPLFLFATIVILIALPVLAKNVFGLREHLVVLGIWPYLVLRISDPEANLIGWRTRLVVGIWMGATLLFKYLYSVVVLLVEMADAGAQRRVSLLFRIENLAAGGLVAIYLICWLGIDPSQRAAISAMLSAIDANLSDPVQNAANAATNLLLAFFFLLAHLVFKIPKRVTLIGMALVIGAVVVAWAQERWYSHHLFPITLAYIAWWWMVGKRLKWWGHVAIALSLAAPIGSRFLKTDDYNQEVRELEIALYQAGQSVADKRVGILNMHPSPYNQYLVSHDALRWNATVNNAYVSAELKPFDRMESKNLVPPPLQLKDPGRRMLHDEMIRLWEDMPPDAIILDHSSSWPLRYVDVEWEHIFSEDPRFAAILSRYRPILHHKGKKLEFIYYVRADSY